MKTATLKTAPERFVRDPVTRLPLDPAGEEKPLDDFWRRRLADRDVIDLGDVTAAGTASGNVVEDDGAKPQQTNSRRAKRAATED